MGWQIRLACGNNANLGNPTTLEAGTKCRSALIDIPTGCGKTAGIVFAWLWNRIILDKSDWPSRLVYCLPMRTLVNQTRKDLVSWLRNLQDHIDDLEIPSEAISDLRWLNERSPILLMGGEENDTNKAEWDLYPERPAILIGTQDMVLSRTLNRGYSMSRYRWPRHFGLLNNDCLWVCDEIQLMGPGVATACQLEAFRCAPSDAIGPRGLGSFFSSRSATWYASATTSEDILETREWRTVQRPAEFVLSLTDAERADTVSTIGLRRFALKTLEVHRDWHFGQAQPPDERVTDIITRHRSMVAALREHDAPGDIPRRSLIICNRVDRAVGLYDGLRTKQNEGELQDVDIVLLHSRFRHPDRKAQADRLQSEQVQRFAYGQIVISTQVIEAGVDVSSGILWTEVAPLSSIVQRLGRLNRSGEFGSSGQATFGWTPLALVVGLELPHVPDKPKDKKEEAERKIRARYLPYDQLLCENARVTLPQLSGDASPAKLESIRNAIATSIERCPYSLQRHELLDFFDTDSNLSLGYTDVTPFVRGLDDDTDVYVLWREWEGNPNDHFRSDVGSDELCAVPISRLTGKDHGFPNWRRGWLWLRSETGERHGNERGKKGEWISAGAQGLSPGATLLLPRSAGGYDSNRGWTGNDDDNLIEDLFQAPEFPSDEDALCYLSHGWRSIADHVQDVRNLLRGILATLPTIDFITDAEKQACLEAALWHDIGKNHTDWRDAVVEALSGASIQPPVNHMPLAKFSLSDSPRLKDVDGNSLTGGELRREIYRLKKLFRPGMAHEIASALALRQRHIQNAPDSRSANSENKKQYLAQLLSEYLVMSHHGHVRKVLRDEIPKNPKEGKAVDIVRGVTEGDQLPAVMIEGEELGCEAISVDCRRMGRDDDGYESYTRGVLRLLDEYGPFRLTYLEALLRAADSRASQEVSTEGSLGQRPVMQTEVDS